MIKLIEKSQPISLLITGTGSNFDVFEALRDEVEYLIKNGYDIVELRGLRFVSADE